MDIYNSRGRLESLPSNIGEPDGARVALAPMQFAALLKRLRTERRMSQWDLAIEIGTDQNRISNYETAKETPSLAMLLRMADTLGIEFRIGETIEVIPRGGAVQGVQHAR